MKKIRRILSFVIAMAMIMSMSTLCFLVTAEGESAAVKLGTQWNFGIAVGDAGSAATLADGPFSLASRAGALSGTVTEVNGVASIVTTEETPRRAFSKSPSGIIDITPAMTTVSQIIFTAPVAGEYYYDVSVVITSTTVRAGLWTEVGKYKDGVFNGTDPAWGYSSAAITNDTFDGWLYNTDRLVAAKTVTLEAGETIVLSVEADTGTNGKTDTDETQLTVNKFDVTYMGEAATTTSESFDLTIGEAAADAKKTSETTGFSLGAMYKNSDGEYVEVPLEDAARASWGDSYPGWYPVVEDVTTPYVFLRSAQGGLLNMRPTSDNGDYLAVIKYTAKEAGDYFVSGSFTKAEFDGRIHDRKTEAEDVDSDITDYLSVQKDGKVYGSATMSEEAPTANLTATVYLDAGESLYIVQRNDYIWTGGAETVLNSLTVYKSAHVCAEWDANCVDALCVECGENTGELDSENHKADPESYTVNGDKHTAHYTACCQANVDENHDFSKGACVCTAEINPTGESYVVTFDPNGETSVPRTSSIPVVIKLTGTAAEYASGKMVITYDPEVLDFTGVNYNFTPVENKDVVVDEVAEGKIVLVIAGQTKELANDYDTVVTLNFTGNKNTDGTDIVIEEAAFSDKTRAETDNLIPAVKYYSTLTVKVTAQVFDVTIDDTLLDGETEATELTDYTFGPNDVNGEYYDYTVSATVNGNPVTVNGDRNGPWTIDGADVTGDIDITVSRTVHTYAYSFKDNADGTTDASGWITGTAGAPNYEATWSFTLTSDTFTSTAGGNVYAVEAINVNGVNIKELCSYDAEARTWTIPVGQITGDIEVMISETYNASTGLKVTFAGNAAGAATGEGVAPFGEAYTFTVTKVPGYSYTISYKVGTNEYTFAADEELVIPAEIIIAENGEIVITVESEVVIDIEVKNYLTLDNGYTMYLVLNKVGKLDNVNFAMNDGSETVTMFWSDEYNAYCYLAVSNSGTPDAANYVYTIVAAEAVNTVDYSKDVNGSGVVDANDAQLVYNMYVAEYEGFTTNVTVKKYLRADVNGDMIVDSGDATNIVDYCVNN